MCLFVCCFASFGGPGSLGCWASAGFVCLSVRLSVFLLFFCLCVCLFGCLFGFLFVCLVVCLCMHLFVCVVLFLLLFYIAIFGVTAPTVYKMIASKIDVFLCFVGNIDEGG